MTISKEEMRKLNEFDNIAESAGGYVAKKNASAPIYNLQDMYKWCVEHGRKVESLSEAEKKLFQVKKTKSAIISHGM